MRDYRGFGVLLACLVLTSCVTSLFPRQDVLLWAPVDRDAGFILKDLTITTRPTTGNLQRTATDLAMVAARKAGLVLADGSGTGAVFDLTLSLEEREFGVDIETYNSVSVVIKIWTSGDQPRQIGQVVYAEETKRTLRAANYLDQVLEAAFSELARKVREGK